MEKKNKTLLVLAGFGLAGFGVYEYLKKKNSTVLIDDTGQPVNTPYSNLLPGSTTTTVTTPSKTTQTPGRPFAPAGNTSDGNDWVGTDNTPITSAVSTTVMQWVNADGSPPIRAMGAARIPSEFNGMYAIIQGGWNPTPDQRTFWNNLVAKYDPNHNYL
jgi:hypothetical protein